MKTVIYAFSGTGNSLHAAQLLSAALGGETRHIPAELKAGRFSCEAETVGFVFPVYCWAAPGIVETFIAGLEFSGSPYIFAVATYAGSKGYALGHVQAALNPKGAKLAAGFGLKMPSNYLPFPQVKPAEECAGLLKKADSELLEIAEKVKIRHTAPVARGFFLPELLLPLLRKFVVHKSGRWDTSFHLNSGCNGCGTCVKVCPAGNIELSGGRPRWRHRCLGCLACANYCPQKAIMMNGFSKKNRYHHPAISAADIESQKIR
ncbi:MAG: EFR1 family ferrodoxin [Elusimicrobiaceae bacterium]|nr:EFR1 family ferrodoxin [Elusimicrobiaceae bacterium]